MQCDVLFSGKYAIIPLYSDVDRILYDYRELENAGNMSDLLQMLGASIDTANAIDGIPIMDEKGAELAPQDASVI